MSIIISLKVSFIFHSGYLFLSMINVSMSFKQRLFLLSGCNSPSLSECRLKKGSTLFMSILTRRYTAGTVLYVIRYNISNSIESLKRIFRQKLNKKPSQNIQKIYITVFSHYCITFLTNPIEHRCCRIKYPFCATLFYNFLWLIVSLPQ